jgi:hypothetical protein
MSEGGVGLGWLRRFCAQSSGTVPNKKTSTVKRQVSRFIKLPPKDEVVSNPCGNGLSLNHFLLQVYIA